jgi:hypothetical protein
MSGQSDRRRPTYLESDVFHSDAINGEVDEGWPILPTTVNLLPGAEAAISARETLASAFR